MNDKADFTQGSILKKLIAFMIPVLGALILQAAYGAVDLLVVGRFGSTSGLSAVSTESQVLNLVTFVVTQFAMGITVLIARYLGEKRPEQIGSVIGGSAVVFTMIAVGLFIVMVGFAHPISVLMQAPKEAVELTSVYVRICGGGIFFIVAYNLLSAIFRGLGDSKSPLLFVFVACIVNVIGSSIAREADNVFYTLAGPEISVATTKAYSTQLIATYALAIQFAKVRGQITEEQYTGYIEELQTIPDKISKIIADKERIQWFAAKQANAKDAFFVGRGIDYAISLEGSLKMKEVSYIHSEAYAAGELKHGTISLIEDGTLVIGVLTQPDLYEKTVSNMVECKSRGAYLMGLTTFGHYNIEDTADFTVYIPKTDPHFATSLAVIPLQLMGYYVSVAKGLDVDKPRNLAKSVTVE